MLKGVDNYNDDATAKSLAEYIFKQFVNLGTKSNRNSVTHNAKYILTVWPSDTSYVLLI